MRSSYRSFKSLASVIMGLLYIGEGVIIVLTLGHIFPNWIFGFTSWHTKLQMRAKLGKKRCPGISGRRRTRVATSAYLCIVKRTKKQNVQ